MRVAITQEGLKATPPVAVSVVAWIQGLTINQVVGIATVVYIGFQLGYLIWKWYREYKNGKPS